MPNRHFKRAVDRLSDVYDAEEYVAFVRTWGTHVLVAVNLGASFNITSFLNENLVNTKSDSWVKNEVSISLTYKFLELGLKYGNSQADKKNAEEFLKNAEVRTGAVGGNILLIETKNYNAWVDSIAYNPGPVKYSTAEIGDVAREVSSKTKGDFIKRATREYIARAANGRRLLENLNVGGAIVPVDIKL